MSDLRAYWTFVRRVLVLVLVAGCASEARRDHERAAEVEIPPPATARAEASASATANASANATATANANANANANASATADEPGERLYAKARQVWIQPSPHPGTGWLGYLSLGGSVRLYQGSAEKAKTWGPGCDIWYRVEPMGFVCGDASVTLDANDPAYVVLKRDAADVTSPYPYQYGESLGSPRYDHLPTPAEQRQAEWDLEPHEAKLAKLRQALASHDMAGVDPAYIGLDLSPAGDTTVDVFPFSPLVREPRPHVTATSTVAFVRAFDEGDRTWLVTSDHALMPKDRVRPYPKTSFHGVALEGDVALPIAFVREKDATIYARKGDAFEATSATKPRLSWTMIDAERVTSGGATFVHTRGGDEWLKDDATLAIAEASKDTAFSAAEKVEGKRTWVDISVYGGTLVAYEGEKPVFATLISPGRGGVPFPGKDPVSTASTPTGTFRVDGKFKTATMVSSFDSNIVHADVPWVQNFHGPHALHGAYWHDAWGELKSGGCVNLSAIDSKFLFDWTEPHLPKDWYGLRSDPIFGAPTRVRVRR